MATRFNKHHDPVLTLDLQFQRCPNAIAAYLIPQSGCAALVETGPGSTKEQLLEDLAEHGYAARDITHVFITHIHLDHAGAAGWLARQGARVHVHPLGAPHMLDPEKLLASARRIYGEQMDELWGEFLPVPEDKLVIVQDGETVKFGDHEIVALHTPGHAKHHISWLFGDFCFTGDVGGVRLPGPVYVRLPLVPPELDIHRWRLSLHRLMDTGFSHIIPTHFGIYPDARVHLESAMNQLKETERWLKTVMANDPSPEVVNEQLITWLHAQARQAGVDENLIQSIEVANPTWMGTGALLRYWRQNHPLA